MALLLAISIQVFAAQPEATITEVFVDFKTETISIMGSDFDLGPNPLEGTLGNFGSLNIITVEPNLIIVNFPDGGLLAGDFFKSLQRIRKQKNDEQNLTIVASEPKGPPGPGSFLIFSGGMMNKINHINKRYGSMVFRGLGSAAEAETQFQMPELETLTQLVVNLDITLGRFENAGSIVRLNHADTSLQCRIFTGEISCFDNTNCVNVKNAA